MAPSDLNLKKSWNPKLFKNREKVWKKEREILDQYKKNQLHNQKLNEINQKDELLSLINNTDTKNKDKEKEKYSKTNWMYRSEISSLDNDQNLELNNDILLGRKKIDESVSDKNLNLKVSRLDKILNKDTETKKESTIEDSLKYSETLSKSDPLYTVKLQQLKRKELLEKQKKIESYKRRESERNHGYKNEYRAEPKHESRHERRHEHDHDRHERRHESRHESRHDYKGEYRSSHRDNHYNRKYDDKSRDRDPERHVYNNYRERK